MSPAGNTGGVPPGPISTLTGKCRGDCALTFYSDRRSSKGIERVWYRSKGKLKNIFKYERPETSASRPYAGGLPQEVLDMVIGHIPPDTPSLKACSRICRSWYIATLPHLHHTLTLRQISDDRSRGGLVPLQKLNKMRLLLFVKRLRIMHCGHLSPEIFNAQALVYFSALTNVQELGFDELDLQLFNPQAQLYLGQFMPRLRYLALRKPRGSYRQLLYLLGLFPNLDDLKLTHDRCFRLPDPPVPAPQSTPLLRGRLTLTWFHGLEFLRDLSELCGGLRFHYIDLVGIGCSRLLLDTCAETLETLRVHPTQWNYMGKGGVSTVINCLTHQPTGTGYRDSIRRTFDLSNNRSLRTLEVEIALTDSGYAMGFLEDLLSTITSPVFSDVVIILQDIIVHRDIPLNALFRAVRDMCEVKPFRLVFRLGKLPLDGEGNREKLKGLIEAEAAKGGLGPLLHPPVIVPYTRVTWSVGSDGHLLAAAAL